MSSDIIDNGINLSNCALSVTVSMDGLCNTFPGRPCQRADFQDVPGFRWDKAELSSYYLMTRELLSDIDIPCKVLTSDRSVDESQILCMLDVFYRSIVDGSFTDSVSTCTLTRQRRSFYKCWWDEELSLLNDNSIKTHQL